MTQRSKTHAAGVSPSPTELLAQLIAFDTTSAKSNLPLISFVRDYLATHGVASHLVPSEDGHKASLFATIGPERDGGVGLSGHSDCVPVDGQRWTSDPFVLRLANGKLYGRGSCDMKGFIACVLASVPLFVKAKLTEPIHIVISYDEEVGCVGVRPMIGKLGDNLPKPRLIVVGEPSNMMVIAAQKRIDSYVTTVTGLEGHSSAPARGVNAIEYASKLVLEMKRIAAELAETEIDARFDPPNSTAVVGKIAGGTATNIIPETSVLKWQVRSLPTTSPETIPARLTDYAKNTLLPEMSAISPKAAIETIRTDNAPGLHAELDSPAVALAMKLTGEKTPHAVSYATEAGLFEQAGCAAVICGPGDIAQAHMADEYVSVAQLEGCMAFLAKLADELSA